MVEITIGSASDLAEIVSCNHAIFKSMHENEPYSLDQYQDRLKDEEPLIYLAKVDNEIVGNSISFAKNSSWYLWILGVHKDHRNKGLGTRLIELNELHAKNNKYEFITAKVYNVSKNMLRLLLERGYYIINIDISDVDFKNNAIILRKHLID